MNFLLPSCVDDPEAPTVELEKTTPVAKVKAWFEENKTKLRLPERESNLRSESQQLILPFFEKEPDWDKFHHYYFPDGREVFEISLDNNQLYLPGIRSGENQQEVAKRALQSILFVKNPTENRFDPLIIRYYPDEETSKRDFKEINYQMIDEKWSGIVDVFTYDEHHFIGFEINKGQILATRNYETIQDGNRKGFGVENMDFRCSVTTTDWYQISYVRETNTFVVQQLSPTRSYSCGSGGYLGDSGPGQTYSYGTSGTGITGLGGGTTGYNPPDVPLPDIYFDFYLDPNPGIKDYSKMTKTQIFLHLISHLKNAKDLGISLNLKNIFTNLPQYADGNAPIQTARAKLLVNGKPYEIYFEYGVKDSWNHIQSFPNLRYKGDNTLWEYRLWNSSSINGALIVIPNEIHDVFLKFYY